MQTATFTATPYRADDVAKMSLNPAFSWLTEGSPEDLVKLESTVSVTIRVDGEPVAALGLIPLWPGRSYMWLILGKVLDRSSFKAARALARDFLDRNSFRRLETGLPIDLADGRRWMRALGFKLEVPRAVAFAPTGADSALYALTRPRGLPPGVETLLVGAGD